MKSMNNKMRIILPGLLVLGLTIITSRQFESKAATDQPEMDELQQSQNSRFRWRKVTANAEDFEPRFQYRIKYKDNDGKNPEYEGAYLYPSIVTEKELHGAWLQQDFFIIKSTAKTVINAGVLKPGSIEIQCLCPGK